MHNHVDQSGSGCEARYSLASRVAVRKEAFGGLAFDHRSWEILEFNRTGYDLLEIIRDKPRTATECFQWANSLSKSLDDSDAEAVLNFLSTLARRKILQPPEGDLENAYRGEPAANCPLHPARFWMEQAPTPGPRVLSAPISIWWDVTAACNLACKQCYSASGRALPDELSLSEVRRILEQLASMKLFYIYFLGGEPLLRRDFLDILAICRDLGISVMVSTNGWFVNQRVAERLANSGIHHVRVSIDGAKASTHDSIRRVSGSFDKAVAAIRYLINAGVPKVGLSPTILRENYEEAEGIIDLAAALNVHEIQLGQVCRVGRAHALSGLTVKEIWGLRRLLPRKIQLTFWR